MFIILILHIFLYIYFYFFYIFKRNIKIHNIKNGEKKKGLGEKKSDWVKKRKDWVNYSIGLGEIIRITQKH